MEKNQKIYKCGEEIEYNFRKLTAFDEFKLKKFDCGNYQLNYHIHNEIILNGEIINEDGLYYIVEDKKLNKIIGVISLASYGLMITIDNYKKSFPAAKIDVFAIDKNYQDLKYTMEPDDNYYFADRVLGEVISLCRDISENYLLIKYIVLYANKDTVFFYRRNHFEFVNEYMIQENNQEIKKNIFMWMNLDV